VLNSPEGLTQTDESASERREETPTARTVRAQKATAAAKSPKGKALKRTAKVTETKAKAGARQTEPTQAKRRKSSNGASTENDSTGREVRNVGQNDSNSSDVDMEDDTQAEHSVQTIWYESDYGDPPKPSDFVDNKVRADPSDQTLWYESDYEARDEASNSVDGREEVNPSAQTPWYESDYGARQESSGSE
jgi:hypothetical protein